MVYKLSITNPEEGIFIVQFFVIWYKYLCFDVMQVKDLYLLYVNII